METAFHEQMGLTPGKYPRIYRLNAAHRDLVRANPKLVTVTQIAYKWGFGHSGRFSLAHRQLFGETPSEVLRRNSP